MEPNQTHSEPNPSFVFKNRTETEIEKIYAARRLLWLSGLAIWRNLAWWQLAKCWLLDFASWCFCVHDFVTRITGKWLWLLL